MTRYGATGDLDLLDGVEGVTVEVNDDDDPQLLRPDGRPVDTWREDYPYPSQMSRAEYSATKRALQNRAAQAAELGEGHRSAGADPVRGSRRRR